MASFARATSSGPSSSAPRPTRRGRPTAAVLSRKAVISKSDSPEQGGGQTARVRHLSEQISACRDQLGPGHLTAVAAGRQAEETTGVHWGGVPNEDPWVSEVSRSAVQGPGRDRAWLLACLLQHELAECPAVSHTVPAAGLTGERRGCRATQLVPVHSTRPPAPQSPGKGPRGPARPGSASGVTTGCPRAASPPDRPHGPAGTCPVEVPHFTDKLNAPATLALGT